MNLKNKTILIAPLNWGLGHATRCIPIINALINNDFVPIIASDGAALQLLQKEFPQITALELPSYNIKYPKNGLFFTIKMMFQLPKIFVAVQKEKKIVQQYIKDYNISGIISDNRFGVYSNTIPSVYITHQLTVLSGFFTYFSSYFHQMIIKKFDECWIPDFENEPNLSGRLSHIKNKNFNLKYIGILSRFEKENLPKKYDLMILLSGPEPQRSLLENKLKTEILNYNGNIIFIKGIVENKQIIDKKNNVLYYNFMTTNELQKSINESKTVLCRSGYTTIMDLIKLDKKAFLIPTTGQKEQEYLAKKLQEDTIFPTSNQKDFTIEMLNKTEKFDAKKIKNQSINWENLFSVFNQKS